MVVKELLPLIYSEEGKWWIAHFDILLPVTNKRRGKRIIYVDLKIISP